MSARKRSFSKGRRGSKRRAPKTDRKTMQLCGQVRRTLEQVLVGELDDEVLRSLCVLNVEPAPDDSNLMVTVGPYAPGVPIDPIQVLNRLGASQGRLRTEVASAITRRKAPRLSFQVAQLGDAPLETIEPEAASEPDPDLDMDEDEEDEEPPPDLDLLDLD